MKRCSEHLNAFLKVGKVVEMTFNYRPDFFTGLTADRTACLVAYFPLTIGVLQIDGDRFVREM